MAQINIRIDDDLKARADALFDELGLNMTTAFNIFIRQTVRQGGIPFEISVNVPNAETRAAMQEIEDIRNGKIPKKPQSVESFIQEMEN
ncbi:MAG: type II toxin-antitoxin system RelB/DinJ family antitoxin [Desulfosporosinus sp.]